jgi:hypothetical protein
MHGLMQFFGEDYAVTLSPLFVACSFLYTVFCLLEALRGRARMVYLAAATLLAIASFTLLSPYFIVHQIFYVNNHVAHGSMMFLAVMEICALAAISDEAKESKTNHVLIIFTLLGGVLFSRIEGPLLTSFLLVLLAETKKLNGKQFLWGTITLTAFLLVWTLLLWDHQDSAGSSISPLRMFAMMAPPIAMCAAYSVPRLRQSSHVWRYFVVLLLLGVLIRHANQNPSHYAEAVSNTLYNLIFLIPWGILWPMAALAFCYTICTPRDRRDSCICYVLLVYPLLLIALSALRNPYRLGWGDSGNRMMGHLIPFVVYLVVFKAVDILSARRVKAELQSSSTSES